MTSRTFISPKSAAISGLLLILPGIILYSLLVLNIEPSFGPLDPLLNNPDPDQPDVVGSLVALALLLLLPVVALVMNLVRIRRTMQVRGSILVHPMNVMLAVASFVFIAAVVGSIIVDQYPCWIGVPNCD